MRTATIERNTLETKIKLVLNLDGTGVSKINTGIGFFDHMLTLFSFHSGIDLELVCDGDLVVDTHHTIEDIGIALGQAINKALLERKGINRYSNVFLPMDEALVQTTIDLCTRSYLVYNVDLAVERVGTFECEMLEEFLRAFTYNVNMTMHINMQYGKNAHHIIEAVFKGMGQALKQAITISSNKVMSTKGII